MNKRKLLSLLLALTMLFTCIPVGIFAEEEVIENIEVEEAIAADVVAEEEVTSVVDETPVPVVEETVVEEAPVQEEATPVAVEVASEPVEEAEKETAPAQEATPVEEPSTPAAEEANIVESPVQEEVAFDTEEEVAEETVPVVDSEATEIDAEIPTEEQETASEVVNPVEEVVEDNEAIEDKEISEQIADEDESVESSESEESFKVGLVSISAGDVYADKYLQKVAGTIHDTAIVYALAHVNEENELDKNEAILVAVNVSGEVKELYTKFGRLTYLDEDQIAVYVNAEHADAVDYAAVKLDPVDFSAAETSAEAEEEVIEETSELVEEETVVEAEETNLPVEEEINEVPVEVVDDEESVIAAEDEEEMIDIFDFIEDEEVVEAADVIDALESEASEFDYNEFNNEEDIDEILEIKAADLIEEEDEDVESAGGAVSISEEPQDVEATENTMISLTVHAVNATSFQWQFSTDGKTWSSIPTSWNGSKTDTLSFEATAARAANKYRVKVFGESGNVMSRTVTITLAQNFGIVVEPEDIETVENSTVTLNVQAVKATSYQWQYSTDGKTWSNVPASWTGSNTDTLTFEATAGRAANQYRVKVFGETGNVVSRAVSITFVQKLAIITEPADVEAVENTTISLSVEAVNAVSYQWQYSSNGSTWNSIPTSWTGSKTDTLTFEITAARAANKYRVKVFGETDNIISRVITISLAQQAFEIITEPQDVEAAEGSTIKLSVEASNATSYQWQYSTDGKTWNNVPTSWTGSKTKEMTFEVTAARAANQYRVKVNNGTDSVISRAVTITLTKAALSIVKEPQDVEAAENSTIKLSVEASNATSYQWQYSTDGKTWNNVPTSWAGSKTNEMTFEITAARALNQYRVRVSNSTDSINSRAVTISIVQEAQNTEIVTEPEDVETVVNTTITLSVEAENAISYQWQYSSNGTTWSNVPSGWTGSTTKDLTFEVTTGRAANLYRVKVFGENNNVISRAVKITLVSEVPVILEQPKNVVAVLGQDVYFNVSAENATSFQWQYSTDGVNWNDVPLTWSGSTTNTLSFIATKDSSTKQYRVTVIGKDGNVISDIVNLELEIIVDDVTYENITETTLRVVSYTGNSSSLIIPEVIEGMTVTEIGEAAFAGNTELVSIDLPDTITIIGKRAFKGCSNLREMN